MNERPFVFDGTITIIAIIIVAITALLGWKTRIMPILNRVNLCWYVVLFESGQWRHLYFRIKVVPIESRILITIANIRYFCRQWCWWMRTMNYRLKNRNRYKRYFMWHRVIKWIITIRIYVVCFIFFIIETLYIPGPLPVEHLSATTISNTLVRVRWHYNRNSSVRFVLRYHLIATYGCIRPPDEQLVFINDVWSNIASSIIVCF